MLNIVALVLLGRRSSSSSTDLFHSSSERLFLFSFAPLLLLVAVVLAPTVVRQSGSGRVARVIAAIRGALLKVRTRPRRLPRPAPRPGRRGRPARRLGPPAARLLRAVHGARPRRAAIGIGAAAAVLFAVNVTAVIPATPSNIGVFQLATISVLTTGFGVGAADALAYGVILQAVEIATAVALGLPALVREGVTWQDMRLRALSAAPVRLRPARRRPRTPAESRLGASIRAAILVVSHPERLRDPDLQKPPQPPNSPEQGMVRQPGPMEVSTSVSQIR